jgi:hypothetical protein
MKQRIKQWWNGKTVVVDDGGYVPRVVEQRPWVRTFYENDRTGFWTITSVALTPLWVEIFNFMKFIVLKQ